MKLFLVLAGLVLAVSLAHGEDDTNGSSDALPAGSLTGPPTPAPATPTCPALLCGKQGGGVECPENQCCSEDGKCGFGEQHCGDNCQSGPCFPGRRQRCGKDYGNKQCTNNYCCSAAGHCGFGFAYCGHPQVKPNVVCQSGFCNNAECSEEKKCTNNMCCGPDGICGVGMYYYCGLGCKGGPCYPSDIILGNATSAPPSHQLHQVLDEPAGSGSGSLTGPPTPPSPSPPSKCKSLCGSSNGGLLCPDNQCCSKDGKCGLGDDHCDAGCQSGPCYPSRKQVCGHLSGRNCTNNYCCGPNGYCGLGPNYCYKYINGDHWSGCQSDYGVCFIGPGRDGRYTFGASDMTCDSYGITCRNNFCCNGRVCGLGAEYCGNNCKNGPCYPVAAAAANASTLQVS